MLKMVGHPRTKGRATGKTNLDLNHRATPLLYPSATGRPSLRYGLTGRPDRLIRVDGTVIPEEWKSARRLGAWHRAQMGVYFILIEEQLSVRPPHGVVVLGFR